MSPPSVRSIGLTCVDANDIAFLPSQTNGLMASDDDTVTITGKLYAL